MVSSDLNIVSISPKFQRRLLNNINHQKVPKYVPRKPLNFDLFWPLLLD